MLYDDVFISAKDVQTDIVNQTDPITSGQIVKDEMKDKPTASVKGIAQCLLQTL